MAVKLKPVHPGEVLRVEFMEPFGLSTNGLALDLRVPVTRIVEVVHERRAVPTNTALRLGRLFGASSEFWLNLQTGTIWRLFAIRNRPGLNVNYTRSSLP